MEVYCAEALVLDNEDEMDVMVPGGQTGSGFNLFFSKSFFPPSSYYYYLFFLLFFILCFIFTKVVRIYIFSSLLSFANNLSQVLFIYVFVAEESLYRDWFPPPVVTGVSRGRMSRCTMTRTEV